MCQQFLGSQVFLTYKQQLALAGPLGPLLAVSTDLDGMFSANTHFDGCAHFVIVGSSVIIVQKNLQ